MLDLFFPSTDIYWALLSTRHGTRCWETAVDGPAWSLPSHRFCSGMQPTLYYHSACNPEPVIFLLLVCFPIRKMRTWRKPG